MDKLLPGRSLVLSLELVRKREIGVPISSLLGGSLSASMCRLIRSQDLGQQLGMCAVKSLPEKNGEMGFFSASSASSRGDICRKCLHACLTTVVVLFI